MQTVPLKMHARSFTQQLFQQAWCPVPGVGLNMVLLNMAAAAFACHASLKLGCPQCRWLPWHFGQAKQPNHTNNQDNCAAGQALMALPLLHMTAEVTNSVSTRERIAPEYMYQHC
jgi:hypothetical protein